MLEIMIKPNCTIQYIKLKALREFYGESGLVKLSSLCRLIHLNKFKQLSDDCNVSDEDISENGNYLNCTL